MIKKIRHKLWFLLDLPVFVKEQKFTKGLELGAKAGRSMFWMLKKNKNLHLVGIDKWEVLNSKAYKNNDKNHDVCKKRLRKFSNRIDLIKGDANDVVHLFDDETFDFIHYDLVSPLAATREDLKKVLNNYIPKVKKGGYIIGRDFGVKHFKDCLIEDFDKELKICICKGKESFRLKYFKV